MVERAVDGQSFQLLMIGNRLADARQDGKSVAAQVHSQVTARAADALRVVGLDLAQVTVVARDISLPLEDQDGAVVDLRSQPPLENFLTPELGRDLVEHLFPTGQSGRIPVVAVTGTNGKTTTTRLTAHLLGQVHAPVGMCCTEGVYVGSRRTQQGDCSGPKSARSVLQYPDVQAAVLEVARGGILREGLGFDRCDVAIVTNIGEGDHLGQNDIDTPEQLAYVKSTIVWTVLPTGYAVLNAADPLVVNMAQYCSGKLIYFALAEDSPVLTAHRQRGGRAVFTRDNCVLLAEGDQETPLLSLALAPLTQGGRVGFHVENVLAAAAAAWALDLPLEKIRQGLQSFQPSMDQAPARFNLLEIDGLTVILDYGHNTSALVKLFDVLNQFPHKHRTALYSAAGDRRDEDIWRQGEMLGNAFDRVIIYEDTYLRGRQNGDITRLFRRGMDKAARIKEILEVQGGLKGLELAMAVSKPGDLLLIQPDLIDDGVAFLKKFLANGGREITLDEALLEKTFVAAEPPGNPKSAPGANAPGARFEVRDNHLGKAVYSRGAFAAGQRLLVGAGPFTRERSIFSIQVDDDLHVLPDEPLRFINHSCEPNCGLLIRRGSAAIEVHALTDIKAGDELTLDYATFERELAAFAGPCLCATPSCRGRLTGYRDLSAALRESYGRYIAEHLRDVEEPIVIAAAVETEPVGV
jgi:cyanophycin synthetase